jgi:hypothetical protein
MTVSEELMKVERDSLSRMFTAIAAARGIEAVADNDARLMASAENIRHMALTMDTVGTDVLVRLATINDLSEGLLARLIVARAAETGMSLPCYPSALAFFDPILAQLDHVLRDPRTKIN